MIKLLFQKNCAGSFINLKLIMAKALLNFYSTEYNKECRQIKFLIKKNYKNKKTDGSS